jgi:hypothetical protein
LNSKSGDSRNKQEYSGITPGMRPPLEYTGF